MKFQVNKNELINYIKYSYHEFSEGKEISPIKLQKGLYFLFAIWGGTIRSAKNQNTEIDNISNYSDYFFDAKFQTWAYGPVDEKVYQDYKINKNFSRDEAKSFYNSRDDFEQEFLDTVLQQISKSSDFGLVNLSHLDISWNSVYDKNDPYCKNAMDNESIINEYVEKE